MKGYVYILRSENGRLYIGSTTDVPRRLEQHRAGHTRTTKNILKNCVVVFTQGFVSLIEARRAEYRLKKLKRKDYVEKIIKDGYIKEAPKPS